MTIAFTLTRQAVAQKVLGKIQQVKPTAVVSADMELVYEAVDLRLKEIHSLGIYWRKVDKTPFSFSVTSAVTAASATADILIPIKLTISDGSRDEPVMLITPRAYASIRDKAETGTPNKAVWDGSAGFVFHPISTTNRTAKLVYERIADDTANSTAPDVDVAMLRSLCDIVKYDVGDHFGVPEQKMVRWKVECTEAEKRIRNLSAPRADYAPVEIEVSEWDSDGRETDYGR